MGGAVKSCTWIFGCRGRGLSPNPTLFKGQLCIRQLIYIYTLIIQSSQNEWNSHGLHPVQNHNEGVLVEMPKMEWPCYLVMKVTKLIRVNMGQKWDSDKIKD